MKLIRRNLLYLDAMALQCISINSSLHGLNRWSNIKIIIDQGVACNKPDVINHIQIIFAPDIFARFHLKNQLKPYNFMHILLSVIQGIPSIFKSNLYSSTSINKREWRKHDDMMNMVNKKNPRMYNSYKFGGQVIKNREQKPVSVVEWMRRRPGIDHITYWCELWSAQKPYTYVVCIRFIYWWLSFLVLMST